MQTVFDILSRIGILPAVPARSAESLAPVLNDGGLPCMLLDFAEPQAEAAIGAFKAANPDFLIGAGNVGDVHQAERAYAVGAAFLVAEPFDMELLRYCRNAEIPVIPVCSRIEEIETARFLGMATVAIRTDWESRGESFPDIRFVPLGIFTQDDRNGYLRKPQVAFCIDEGLGHAQDAALAVAEAVKGMLGFRIAHVGLNMPDAASALSVAGEYSRIFGLPLDERPGGVFAGTDIEVCKRMFLGEHGHIAFQTNSVNRAMFQLERRGVEFDPGHILYKPDGTAKLAYFKGQIGGFAIHLTE